MYRWIKTSKKFQTRFFNIMITIICVLLYINWLLAGLLLQTNSAIINLNTESVESDDGKLKIEYVNSEETIFLEDGTSISGDKISEYVRTEKGSGSYYTSEGYMSAEITDDEAMDLCKNFLAMEVIITITVVCLTIWKRNNIYLKCLFLVLTIISSVLSDIVWSFYLEVIQHSNFPIWIVVYSRLIVYVIMFVIVQIKTRKKVRK